MLYKDTYLDRDECFIGKCGHMCHVDLMPELKNDDVCDIECPNCMYENGDISLEKYKSLSIIDGTCDIV